MAFDPGRQTVKDFGDQWSKYTDNSGFYGSQEAFKDIIEPLLCEAELAGKTVADIGSGTGRIVNMLCRAGVRKVYAVEPSPAAFSVLKKNTAAHGARVESLNVRGDELPGGLQLDYVLAVGVIQFIPSPETTVSAAFNALKSGGKCFLWVYGKEGNEAYLRMVMRLRKGTVILPHVALAALSHVLNALADVYIHLCRFLPLPMRTYIRDVFSRTSRDKRHLVIYDQLNPAYVKYYSEAEAKELLSKAGFIEVRAFHRHGYSWSVAGTHP